ncbi:hypothetical protein BESB_074370 [Besnoitia besnoiti]|uniref:Uncharacterized protein n=1 Tax=Besnoitia besnoiti TaxID=94643 RepID=A0A2A9M8H2_BESBE|nr:uncharacterized protein BESB_074370 [Besnoitia besnoiti]PFH34285.1 hypothetical protein BESB_074370 [Besnoitia besnoiti]
MVQAPLKKKKSGAGGAHTARKNKPQKPIAVEKNRKLAHMLRNKKKAVGVTQIEESLSGIARSNMEEVKMLGGGDSSNAKKSRPKKV